MKFQFFITLIFIILASTSYTQDNHDHPEERSHDHESTIIDSLQGALDHEHMNEVIGEEVPFSTSLNPGISEFPSKHPMIVHFPIVLLLVAFLTQLASFFIWGKELSAVTFVLLAGGAIGAYVASNFAHPHTTDLNNVAAQLLTLHEDYAAYSKWSSIAALGLKIISHFFFKRKRWIEVVVAVILAGSAYTVVQAGHYGAALTHLHGIGVEGKFLENATHSHEK